MQHVRNNLFPTFIDHQVPFTANITVIGLAVAASHDSNGRNFCTVRHLILVRVDLNLSSHLLLVFLGLETVTGCGSHSGSSGTGVDR